MSYVTVKRKKGKTLGDLPPPEPYMGSKEDLLSRKLDIAIQLLSLMSDWQDYNIRTNNSLPWEDLFPTKPKGEDHGT